MNKSAPLKSVGGPNQSGLMSLSNFRVSFVINNPLFISSVVILFPYANMIKS